MSNEEQIRMQLVDVNSNLNYIATNTQHISEIRRDIKSLENKLNSIEDRIENTNYQLREILEIMKKLHQRFLT